jgi:hypothetical protein
MTTALTVLIWLGVAFVALLLASTLFTFGAFIYAWWTK